MCRFSDAKYISVSGTIVDTIRDAGQAIAAMELPFCEPNLTECCKALINGI
jgi:hypothetical protein